MLEKTSPYKILRFAQTRSLSGRLLNSNFRDVLYFMDNCTIELKHIKLEIDHGRHRHMRHFVDQYYCYKKGYVNSSGNPDWEKILWNSGEIVSKSAQEETDRKNVVKEHVVPLKRIVTELMKLSKGGPVSITDIEECIGEYLVFATITKSEDKKLRERGLTSKMPSEFDDPSSQLFQDKFARYKVAGIELV